MRRKPGSSTLIMVHPDAQRQQVVATRFVCRGLDPHSAIDVFGDHACTGERSSLRVPHDTRDLTGVGLGGCGDTKREKNDEAGGRAYQRISAVHDASDLGLHLNPAEMWQHIPRMDDCLEKEGEKVGISSLHE